MKRAPSRTGLDVVVQPARREASLWRRLRFEAQGTCRELLFNLHLRLARGLALQHFRRRRTVRIERLDYEQFAYEGLLQAIDRYDPLKGTPFAAFARPRIAGNIADGIGKMSELDGQLGQRHRIEQERLRSLRRSEPHGEDSVSELSELAVGLALGLVLQEARLMLADNEADLGPSPYDSLERRELQVRLSSEIARLPANEAAVIRQHYENGLNFGHVAQLLGLSAGRVSQLHRSALDRLRKRIGRGR